MLLINDRNDYNLRYRSGIIDELNRRNIDFSSLGVFDSLFVFFKVVFNLALNKKKFISSNMKCNLVCLVFFWSKGTVIINGLGRYKYNYFFRKLFFLLLLINYKNKKIIFQNYSDYRFFKLNIKCEFYWIPGSGGSPREINFSDDVLIVSRDDKLTLISSSVLSFSNSLSAKKRLIFVGCSPDAVKNKFNNECFIGLGFVPQRDIFSQSHQFYQPRGYGEGLPHSLVDAICSGMVVYITKKDFISFGLYVLGFCFINLDNDFGRLSYSEEQSLLLSKEKVSSDYVNIFLEGNQI